MKKTSHILPLLTLVVLTSCGGNPGVSTSNNSEENKKVSFSLWHTSGQGLQEGIEELANEFTDIIKREEGVEVDISLEYQGSYDDISSKIESNLGTGNVPAIAVSYPDNVATYLSYGTQYVVNLEDYINDATIGLGRESYLGDTTSYSDSGRCDADDIVQSFFEEGRHYAYEGTYSLPWMKSSEIMFYNLDAVKRCFDIGKVKTGNTFDADINTEELVIDFVDHMSWDQMMELGRYAIQHKDYVLPGMIAPVMYDSDGNLFISKMFQEEIPYASADENGVGRIDFETGEARSKAEALITEYAQNVTDGLLTTKILQEGKYSSTFFTAEQVIFAIGSSGGTGHNFPTGDAFDYKISKVPASNGNPTYVSQGPTLCMLNDVSISKEEQALKSKYAWKFLKYLTNTEANTQLCIADSQGYIPMRESCYQTEFFTSFLEGETIYSDAAEVLLNDVSGNYIVSTAFKGSDELRDQVATILAFVAGGQKTVKAAFDDAINSAKKKF